MGHPGLTAPIETTPAALRCDEEYSCAALSAWPGDFAKKVRPPKKGLANVDLFSGLTTGMLASASICISLFAIARPAYNTWRAAGVPAAGRAADFCLYHQELAPDFPVLLFGVAQEAVI